MGERRYTVAYPRRRIPRALLRGLARLVLPLLFRIEIQGRENFPARGPLLVVGNHTAVMEVALMVVYTPWQVEVLGAADVPHERFIQLIMDAYRPIPVNRGNFDRAALVKALDVLRQGGFIAIFPEGGIWAAGRMRAQTGVAWLSYRAGAPVLPIGFGGARGALQAALRLQRPRLTMRVGTPLPAARLTERRSRKADMEAYATRVVEAIRALVPEDEASPRVEITDERFELRVAVQGRGGEPAPYPAELVIDHAEALAQLLHAAPVLKIFTANLRLPTRPLQHLAQEPDPAEIARAVRSILDYLDQENPHLLTYRFGPRRAEAMRLGLEELLALARWAAAEGRRLALTPVRRYTSPEGEEVVQVEQGAFEDWM
jgi:1-acyl-sn-glycerol-3-phosphate acyltransferase